MSTDTPTAREELTVTEVDGELLVLNEAAGQVHRLNATAAFVFEHCDGDNTKADIAERIVATFDVSPEVAARDLDELLTTFRDNQLLSD